MKRMKFYSALLVAALCVSTYSPTVIKAETLVSSNINEKTVSVDQVAERKADLEVLFKTLEKNHPDIYNQNNQAVFVKKIEEIEKDLHTMSDFEFAIALSELTALIGDSHTKLSIGSQLGENAHYLPISVTWVKEGILLTGVPEKYKHVLGGILTSINGMPIEEVKQKIKPMISFDNEVYLNRQFVGNFYVGEILTHYGVLSSLENITLEIKMGDKIETIKVDAVDRKTMKTMDKSYLEYDLPQTAVDQSKLYFFKQLDDETLYIQYNACRQDEHLSMETFAKQVSDAITQKEYKRAILDLRYNGGGSDGVLIPLMYVLDEKNEQDGMQLYTLIGNNTFSSALINAVMLKQIGSVMVGAPTGGSVDHFGSVSGFELPHSKITGQYSNRYFDLATLLEAAKPYGVESFLPDLLVEQTREDYLVGKDTALQAILADTENKVTAKTELTRAALAVYLGRDYLKHTESTIGSVNTSFEDVSMFSYYTPYIVWANTNHLMNGESETTFAPDRACTRAEVAVVLMRYADLIGVSLNDLSKESIEIADIGVAQEWEKEAVKMVGGTKLFPLNNGMFKPDEIISRKAFEELFASFEKLID